MILSIIFLLWRRLVVVVNLFFFFMGCFRGHWELLWSVKERCISMAWNSESTWCFACIIKLYQINIIENVICKPWIESARICGFVWAWTEVIFAKWFGTSSQRTLERAFSLALFFVMIDELTLWRGSNCTESERILMYRACLFRLSAHILEVVSSELHSVFIVDFDI